MIKKPSRWGFDKGRITPGWDWFWSRDLLGCGALWEGAGKPYNFVDRRLGTFSSGASWSIHKTGPSIVFDGTVNAIVTLDSPRLAEMTLPFTLVFYGIVNDINKFPIPIQTSDFADRQANYYGAILDFNTNVANAHLEVQYGDGAGAASGNRRGLTWNNVLSFGTPTLWAVTMRTATTGIAYKDGASLGSPDTTSGTGGALANHSTYRGRLGSGRTANYTSSTHLMWAVFDRELTAVENKQLALDPFGPFRQSVRKSVRSFTPVTVNATTDTLTLVEYAANVNAAINVQASADTMTLVEYPATVSVSTATHILNSRPMLINVSRGGM